MCHISWYTTGALKMLVESEWCFFQFWFLHTGRHIILQDTPLCGFYDIVLKITRGPYCVIAPELVAERRVWHCDFGGGREKHQPRREGQHHCSWEDSAAPCQGPVYNEHVLGLCPMLSDGCVKCFFFSISFWPEVVAKYQRLAVKTFAFLVWEKDFQWGHLILMQS